MYTDKSLVVLPWNNENSIVLSLIHFLNHSSNEKSRTFVIIILANFDMLEDLFFKYVEKSHKVSLKNNFCYSSLYKVVFRLNVFLSVNWKLQSLRTLKFNSVV